MWSTPSRFREPSRASRMWAALLSKKRAAVVAAANGELGRERHSGAAALVFGQELADQLLAEPIAVDVGGVPEIDAELERPRQRPQRLRLRLSVRRSRRSSWRRSRRPKPSLAAKRAAALLENPREGRGAIKAWPALPPSIASARACARHR